MHKSIMDKFAELYEKQDMLSKLTEKDFLHEYGYSEIHCIDAIGRIENPNVTKIANALNMTRGAISKMTKRQLQKGLISSYSLETNQKEIYFRLTDTGQKLFKEHKQRHMAWEKRDEAFLRQYEKSTLAMIERFLDEFNAYLKDQITELSSRKNGG